MDLRARKEKETKKNEGEKRPKIWPNLFISRTNFSRPKLQVLLLATKQRGAKFVQ